MTKHERSASNAASDPGPRVLSGAAPDPGTGTERTTDPTGTTARQVGWNYVVFALSKSSTLVMTIVLARLLSPADFGLFALALLVINLFDYVKDLGVSAALVQSRSPWSRIAATGMTLSVTFGLAAGVLVASTAGWLAAAMGSPELASLVQVLAVALVISALGVVPASRLRRDLDFRRRLVPEFAGAVAKTGLSIGLALSGFGVWSLVYGQLAAAVVTCVLYWCVAREPVRLGFDRAVGVDLLRFGAPVTAVTLLAFAIYNVDYLFIGVRLGDVELGLYSLAYRLPELLVLNLCIVVSEVLFSSLSRLQDDPVRLGRQYQQVLGVVVALTAPIGVAMAVTAPELVDLVYGEAYAAAAGPLAVIALFTVVYSVSFHSGDVYKAIGSPGTLTAINAAKLIVMVGPLWWAAGQGMLVVALVLLGIEVVHCGVRMVVVRMVVRLSLGGLLLTVFRPILAAAAMGGAMLGAGVVLPAGMESIRLLVLALVGVSSYALALRLVAPELARQGRQMLRLRRADV
jgi:lipopolysaccharide exporter